MKKNKTKKPNEYMKMNKPIMKGVIKKQNQNPT